MCLALPARVVAVDGDAATVDADGVSLPVSLAVIDDVAVGDFVIVHVGYAIAKIDAAAAEAQLAAMRAGSFIAEAPFAETPSVGARP